jgi:large subunit ribosomal protein L17
VTSLLKEERIETTEDRAKDLRRIAERMISLGKQGNLHAKRQALSYLFDETVVKKLFDEIAPKYKERNGGYTRILKTGYRRGDGASMALVELV